MQQSFKNHFFSDINREILEDTLFTVCQKNEGILDLVVNHLVSTLSNNEVEKWDDMLSSNFWNTYEQKCLDRGSNPVALDHNQQVRIEVVK